MADVKISGLPASTVPLAGTEVLPIVQSTATKQVSVANLTAGRTFDALGMTLTSTDAGASQAPTIDLYRDSASPAASDTIGEIEFNGKDSAANKQAYALLHGSILSPTSGAEQGQIHFETATAGALTEKMIIGTSNLVINEPGNIFNVRIEGDTDANLFYTDATNSRVGIGTISPATKLDVNGSITSADLTASTAVVADANKKLVSLVQPAVSAYKSTNQSITTFTATKITFDTETFDTNNNFASSTFTPTVAGYYQISSGFFPSADSTTFSRAFLSIYKNGAEWQKLQDITTIGQFITFLGASGSCLVYCNGTTDYIEAYGFIAGTNPVISSGSGVTYFDAVLVRGA